MSPAAFSIRTSVDEPTGGARATVAEANRHLRKLRDGVGAASAVLEANRNIWRFEADRLPAAS